jgi:hypothetical protein
MSNEIVDTNELVHAACEGLAEFWDEQMVTLGTSTTAR